MTAQVVSNINACQAVVEAVRTTLGPRGMDKLVVDQRGEATITNDGATLVKLLDIVHPAAKMLANIARSQDEVVGDGTTRSDPHVLFLTFQKRPFGIEASQ